MTDKEMKATDRLLKAVGNFVDVHGGNAVVAGGIRVEPLDKFKFNLVIGVTGTPPRKESK